MIIRMLCFHEYNHRTIYQWNVFSGDVSVDLPYNLKAGVRVNGNIRGYKLERERPSGSINFRYKLSSGSKQFN